MWGYIIRAGTKPALPSPPSQTVGSSSSDTRGETGSSLSRKVWAHFLAWACWWEWFEESQLVTPCAVPTRCIKRGFQPLRQTRWHLSQVQNLFLELFVVKLQSALEIRPQSWAAHRRSPLGRPSCPQVLSATKAQELTKWQALGWVLQRKSR